MGICQLQRAHVVDGLSERVQQSRPVSAVSTIEQWCSRAEARHSVAYEISQLAQVRQAVGNVSAHLVANEMRIYR